MHIPHKQYRKVEPSGRKNLLILAVAGMIFLLTILFSSHDFGFGLGRVEQASILSIDEESDSYDNNVDDNTDYEENTATDNSYDNADYNYDSGDYNNTDENNYDYAYSDPSSGSSSGSLGSDPGSLLSKATNTISKVSDKAASVIESASNKINKISAIAQTVSPDVLSKLSDLDVGTLGSALGISALGKLSSVEDFIGGSSIVSKTASILGFSSGFSASDLIGRIEKMGYEARRNFFGSNYRTVDEVASIIEKLSTTTARDTVLDMMDAGNASQVTNAISIGKAKSILGEMTKDNGAKIMNGMDPERVISLLGQFSPVDALQRLSLMDDKKRAEALRLMSASQLAAIANVMTPDNAADVLTKIDIQKASLVYMLMGTDQRTEAVNRLDTSTRNSIFNEVEEIYGNLSSDEGSEEADTEAYDNYDSDNYDSDSEDYDNSDDEISQIGKGALDYMVDAFGIPTAYAAEESNLKSEVAEGYQSIIKNLNDLISFLFFIIHQVLFWPLICLISSLVDNDFVMGGQISETLRSVWIQIRDLVNIGFVFILLLIALFSVIGSEELESKLPMKSTLPKVIIAMILVNFTFFISKVAIDTVNVLTVAVYAIPSQITNVPETDLSGIEVVSYQSESCDQDRTWGCEEWRAKCYVTQGGKDFSSKDLEKDILYYKSHPEKMDEGSLMAYKCISSGKGEVGPYEQCLMDQKEKNYNYFMRESVDRYESDSTLKQDAEKYKTDNKYYNKTGDDKNFTVDYTYFTYKVETKKDENGDEKQTRNITYSLNNLYNLEKEHVICHFPMVESEYLKSQGADGASGAEGSGSDKKSSGNLVNKGIAFTIAKNFEGLIQPDKFYKDHNYGKDSVEQTPGNLFTFLANNIFIIFMFVAIFFAFLALAVALLIRAVVLWVLIALSPLIVIEQILFKGLIKKDLFGMFISHLLIPLKVAGALTLGFIFMNAVGNMFTPDVMPTLSNLFEFIKGNDVNTGIIAANGDKVSIVQHILYLFMTVFILWTGVFMAFEGTEAEKFTNAIKGAGEFVFRTPQYLPLPIPGTKGGASIASMRGAVHGFKSGLEGGLDMEVQKGAALGNALASKMTGKQSTQIKQIAHDSKGDAKKFIIDIKGNPTATKDLHGMANPEFKDTLKTGGLKVDHLDDATLTKLKSGDQTAWSQVKDKDGKAIDYENMAKALRGAQLTAAPSAVATAQSPSADKLLDASTSAGVVVGIGELNDSLQKIDEKLKADKANPTDTTDKLTQAEQNNLQDKKANTIKQTAQDVSKVRGGLTPDDAQKIAEALRKIDPKKRDDALEGLEADDLLKVAKAMGIKEVPVSVHDEKSNDPVRRNYKVNSAGKAVDQNDKEIAKPEKNDDSEVKDRKTNNLNNIKEATLKEIQKA